MITNSQNKVLEAFHKYYPYMSIGEAWCYDGEKKILYSPVSESKLKVNYKNLPEHNIFVVLTGRTIERLQSVPRVVIKNV